MGSGRRFESQFDPDDLAKITHRGLKPRSKKEQPSVTKASRDNLKTAALEEDTPAVTSRRLMDQIFGGVIAFFKGLCVAPVKKVTMCENYGHLLKPGWKGEFPICHDCGATITSTDQVRSSNLKNPKTFDDPYSQNNGRKYVR